MWQDEPTVPKTWSEMSFELKGMMLYHVSMIALMLFGRSLAFIDQAFIAGGLALSISIMSAIRRLRHRWHWRGVSGWRVLGVVLMLALIVYFLLTVSLFSLSRLTELGGWTFAAVGLATFMVLHGLRIVHFAEATFQSECGDEGLEAPPPPPRLPFWQAAVKWTFFGLFIAVWLWMVTAMYFSRVAFQEGLPAPAGEKVVAVTDKGVTRYVTIYEKQRGDDMLALVPIAFLTVMAFGAFVQFVLKVRVFHTRS